MRRIIWSMPPYSADQVKRRAGDNAAVTEPSQPAPEHVAQLVRDRRAEITGLDTYTGD